MKAETSKERFKRIAAARTNAVLQKLRVLSNCANRQYYDYTEEEVDIIFSAIEKKVKEAKSKFFFSKEEKFKL